MIKSHLASQLATFVHVAQYSSFSQASRAMHLTTGAISQQLLQLEETLGFSLFERHSRGVNLTPQGQVLVSVAEKSFEDLEKTIDMLSSQGIRKEVKLKLTPSFAFKWLVPRLESFYRDYPDIQIQTFAEGALVDSDRRDYDLAIDYGPIPYRRAYAELLFEEYLVPVMSPGYLAKHTWMLDSSLVSEWDKVVFLHDAMPWANAPRDFEWLYWSSEMRMDIPAHQGHFFNRTDMAMSAAEAGLGIAMARKALIANELESQRLVAPFGEIKANAGYYLLSQNPNEATEIFVRWLKKQIE
ncbi:LysR substrate-binding domain-containing protein [Vibrio sp.]|nr:LysR substrate-binding domain-containing protein [Vibrio sp.]